MHKAHISFINSTPSSNEQIANDAFNGLAEELKDAQIKLVRSDNSAMGIGDALSIVLGNNFMFSIASVVQLLLKAFSGHNTISLQAELGENRLFIKGCSPEAAANIVANFLAAGKK